MIYWSALCTERINFYRKYMGENCRMNLRKWFCFLSLYCFGFSPCPDNWTWIKLVIHHIPYTAFAYDVCLTTRLGKWEFCKAFMVSNILKGISKFWPQSSNSIVHCKCIFKVWVVWVFFNGLITSTSIIQFAVKLHFLFCSVLVGLM